MKNSELIKIDLALDNIKKIAEILENKRGFYIYYNEPTKSTKNVKIHRHDCGFCAWGSGMRINSEPGKNGVWIGPFKNSKKALEFAQNIIKPNKQSNHTCIK